MDMICGGPTARGDSTTKRKMYVHFLQAAPTNKMRRMEDVTFTSNDLIGLLVNHDDPLVIMVILANYEVRKMLVNTSNAVDVLYYEAFDRLRSDQYVLTPLKHELIGFFLG